MRRIGLLLQKGGADMLKDWKKPERPSDEEIEERLTKAREALATKQTAMKEQKLPVLVVLDGWGTAGKGSVLGRIIRNIDPRFFQVETMDRETEDEKRRPFLYRYFIRIPEAGKYKFFDGSWMDEAVGEYIHGRQKKSEYKKRIESICRFERQLTDQGYLLLKFFFHIGRKEQKKRIEELLSDKNTGWRVSGDDLWQNKNYARYKEVYDEYMTATNLPSAPWHLVDAKHKKWAELQVLEILLEGIDQALAEKTGESAGKRHTASEAGTDDAMPDRKSIKILPIPKLSEILLDQSLTEEEYQKELDECQKRLKELHNILYRKKIPVIIAYEGWDAAGKGGNIKRITGALDPRGFEVHPIASPEPHEKARHYLWRFWNRLPKTGHIAIFDRTWYGRVMVERLEGFCSESDWKSAYREINEFEKELSDWGAIVIKFWVQIDKDVQLQRFTDRQNTPEKRWKITEEDWRNREKWDQYETAVDEMLQKTNTAYAPWVILESNDKKYARIKALKTVIQAIEQRI